MLSPVNRLIRLMLLACAVLAAGAEARSPKPAPLSETEIAAIKILCEDLSEQYAFHLDGKDPEKLASLFTDDGVWEVLSKRMVGPEAIRTYWKSRLDLWKAGYGRIHQMANQVVTVLDRDHAVGRSTVLIYMFQTPNSAPQSLAPTVISRNEDEYVRTAAGWKFKRRTISTVASQDAGH